MQKIKTELTINIPEELIVIDKTEYERLKEQANDKLFWDIEDVAKYLNKGKSFVYSEIIGNMNRLSQIKNFTEIPTGGRSKWLFQADKMKDWLRDTFANERGCK